MAQRSVQRRATTLLLLACAIALLQYTHLQSPSSHQPFILAASAAIVGPDSRFTRAQTAVDFESSTMPGIAALRGNLQTLGPRTRQQHQREQTEEATELKTHLDGLLLKPVFLDEMLLARPPKGYHLPPCPQLAPWRGSLSSVSVCKWAPPQQQRGAGGRGGASDVATFAEEFLEDKRGRATERECADRRWLWPRPLTTGGEVCVEQEDDVAASTDDDDDKDSDEDVPDLVSAKELMRRVQSLLDTRRDEQRARLAANEADEVTEEGALGRGGVVAFSKVFVDSRGTVFNQTHVFAVDACGRAQWRQGSAKLRKLQESVSFPSGTRVSAHRHLINLLPYEEDEEEEEEHMEQQQQQGLRCGEVVSQARSHNSRERLIGRLLPVLFLLSSSLMPTARQYPMLLRNQHLLEHVGASMFGVDLASLSIPQLSSHRRSNAERNHLFFADTLLMPLHVSSLCGLASAGRPTAPDALWITLRANHMLPPGGLPVMNEDWTPRVPAPPNQQQQQQQQGVVPLVVGEALPDDWLVMVSLVWSARVMSEGGEEGGAAWGTEEAMGTIVKMMRDLFTDARVAIYEEHMPLKKAKELFSRAILLVGPTSPALSNLIFMPFNATVIELLPDPINIRTAANATTHFPTTTANSKGQRVLQYSTATWHYRLAERVGIHHLLSVCDASKIMADSGEQCHVDEVYASVTATVRNNPALQRATGLPSISFPPDDVSSLGDFRDRIPGSRLRPGSGEVAAFRQWADCVASKGEWRYNATPRLLPWEERGVQKCDLEHERAGGIAGPQADDVARMGAAAASEWKVRETLKYEWVVPWEKCPKERPGLLPAFLGRESNPGELFSRFDGQALCELARRRRDGLQIAFIGDSLSRESHIAFVNNIIRHMPKPATVISRRRCMPWVASIQGKVDVTCMEYRFDGAGCPNLVVHYVANRRLIAVNEERKERIRWINTPWMEIPGVRDSHVLIINRGAHYKVNENVVESVTRMLRFIRYNHPEKLVIYRTTPPGHLNCRDFQQPIKERQDPSELPFHWGDFRLQNELVRSAVEETGAVFMDVDPATALRPDGHRGDVGGPRIDCLHYCNPGPEDQWCEFMYNVIQRLVPVET